MTESFKQFNTAIIEARELLECYDILNNHPEILLPSGLKKASLILILTAWETYVEDVAAELFNQQFNIIKGSKLGRFSEKQFAERLKFFNNPNSSKTKLLFKDFFDFDITEHWKWNNVLPNDARTHLNMWISKRGDAVHRSNVGLNQAEVIKRSDLLKCFNFFTELVQVTDKTLETI